ncbi:hypothetical protein ACFONG_19525 [Uliginosibacterium paludis]|uniref:Uncharacterized protein n=1 Tax=Uliginosibacterium paludis TaxID=1615952 RepID=A0ABV2CUN9_9RHOO
MIADLPDESFEHLSIPRLGRRDREAFVARKLAQCFPDSRYATAVVAGAQNAKLTDHRVILTGIPHPEPLDLWLGLMLQEAIAVSAVLTPALLCKQILKLGEIQAPHGLLICLHGSRQRHIYFNSDQPCFTRLIPQQHDMATASPENCHREIRQTLQYLWSKRLLERGDALPVLLLTDAATARALLPTLSADPLLKTRHLLPDTVPSQAGLPVEVPSSIDREILVRAAASRKRSPQLAPPDIRKHARAREFSRKLSVCCLILALPLLAASFHLHSRIHEARQQAADLNAARQHQESDLHALEALLPPTISDAETLRGFSRLWDTATAQRQLPGALLSQISQSLERFPDIEAESVEWHSESPALTTDSRKTELKLNAYLAGRYHKTPAEAQSRMLDLHADIRAGDFNDIEIPPPPDVEMSLSGSDQPDIFHFSLRLNSSGKRES